MDDGDIQLVGRRDTQIKLRGQRIELGEVEHHIRRSFKGHFAVAVDIIQPADRPSSTTLVAFVAPNENVTTVDPESERLLSDDPVFRSVLSPLLVDLNNTLFESTPTFMIPSHVLPLRLIPLTRSGKVDRKKLRSLGSSLTAQALSDLTCTALPKESVQPDREESERRMARLWAKVIPVDSEKIKPYDNFFTLGGDSINAMQVVSLAKDFNLRLTTKQIFQYPTLAAMSSIAPKDATSKIANHDDDDVVAGETTQLAPSVAKDDPSVIAQAPDIQAFMVVCGLLKSHGYVNYFTFDLDGPMDVARLEYSCRALVDRHSSLRTAFRLQSGRLLQVRPHRHNCEVIHVSSREATQSLVTGFCALEAACESSLENFHLQFLIVTKDVSQHTLVMRISHAQFDGASLHLIYQDLKMIYEGTRLPPAPQYPDYALAVRLANDSEAEGFWRGTLRGSSMSHILRHSKPSYKHVINEKVSHTIPHTPVHAHGITFATLVKAAWAIVLGQLSRTSDVVFGYAVTGRNLPLECVDKIVGDCNNAALARVRLDAATTVLELLRQIQDQSVSAMPYETVGQRQMVEKCTDWPRWTRYSSSVNHQNYTMAGANNFRLGKADCTVSYKDLEADRRDIQIYSYLPQNGEVKLEMAFCNQALPTCTVESMLKKLGDVVQVLAADLRAPLPVLTELESESLPRIPFDAADNSLGSEKQCSRIKFQYFNFSTLDPRPLVEKVWTRLASCFQENEILHSDLDPDLPFYEVGGDLIYAAQLSTYYHEEKVSFPIEDLIENPTQKMQIDLLIAERNRSYRGSSFLPHSNRPSRIQSDITKPN
ncbi:MAG: hypothetical protein Q9201_000837 [Fulgogasparrea decipioides]